MSRRSLFALSLALGALLRPSGALPQTCVANVPHVDGQWRTLPYLMPINPISATLLHDGRHADRGRLGERREQRLAPAPRATGTPSGTRRGTTQASVTVQNIEYDVFCSGTAVLPDGRPLVVGGTSDYSFTGEARSSIFDPATLELPPDAEDGGRPLVRHRDGARRRPRHGVLRPRPGRRHEQHRRDLRPPERRRRLDEPGRRRRSRRRSIRAWRCCRTARCSSRATAAAAATPTSWLFDPVPRTWTASAATTIDRTLRVGRPPAAAPARVHAARHELRRRQSGDRARPRSSTSPPARRAGTPAPSMSSGRIQMNATLLPNGKVLAEGGSVNNEIPSAAGKRADLYDPVANAFASGGTASYSRLYHSVAILLPDATVVSMGSNPGSRGGYEPAIEIYTPAYLFDANDQLITTGRPSITGLTPASGPLGYNAPFSVTYTSTSPISSAVLMRPGVGDPRLRHGPAPDRPLRAVTAAAVHAAPARSRSRPRRTATSRRRAGTCSSSLDSAGVPSTARFIQLSPYTTSPPVGADRLARRRTSRSRRAARSSSPPAPPRPSTPGSSRAARRPRRRCRRPATSPSATPGEFVASLTVIDAAGNSDPSPPTRTITVLPSDRRLRHRRDALVAGGRLPGGSTTFTVTVDAEERVHRHGDPRASGASRVSRRGITSGGFSPSSITGGRAPRRSP